MRLICIIALSLPAFAACDATVRQPSGIAAVAGGACPDDDGSGSASAGSPQYPSLLATYAATIHALGCKVAGVDYRVGLPTDARLRVPTASNLPPGCSVAGSVVSCNADGLVVAGYDFTNMQLAISGRGWTVTDNNFAVGSTCQAPIRYASSGGTVTIVRNTIDGGGGACRTLAGDLNADVFGCSAAAGSVIVFERNWQKHVGEDGLNVCGPHDGSVQVLYRYNLIDRVGWRGHPDGLQLVGGGFVNSVASHNTFVQAPPGVLAGAQPLHIEAQLKSTIADWTVAYNTMVTPGTCRGGRNWPAGCTTNVDIACKQDGPGDKNTGFSAYGNYFDWSGAIAAMSNGYACQKTSWGVPLANVDMLTGAALPAR